MNSTAYDSDGPVFTVSPVYPDEEADATENSRAGDALEVLQHGLLIVLRGGCGSTAIVTGALARLCGLFESDAAAAQAVGCHRSTMMRATRRLRDDLSRAAQQAKRLAVQ